MKKYLLLIVSVVVSSLLMAGNVTPEQAEQVAQQFLNSHRLTAKSQSAARLNMVQHRKTSRRAGAPTAYYVFNVEQEKGFVVVSGDDRTVPILGYGETGTFDVDNMPENMKAWLQSYADQIEWLNAHPETPVATRTSRHAQNAVKPLIQTHWGQEYPYNLFCPMDGSNMSQTGCVATAMAQLMYYHQYPAQTTMPIPAYTTDTKKMQIGEIGVTTISWADMQKSYTGVETDTQRKAVAKLMQLCGASVEMDYTSSLGSSSNGYLVGDRLKKYFDYDGATTSVLRDDYRAADWEDLVYEELAQKRPVYYFGSSIGGGHAFIVDGYDGHGLYHVNWGWNGSSDDYFVLSVLDPGNNSGTGASSTADGYSLNQGAVIGAQRNTGVVPQKTVVMTTQNIYAETTTIPAANNLFTFTFKASFYNWTGESNSFDFCSGVYNEQGELCSTTSPSTRTFEPNVGYKDYSVTVSVPSSWSGTYKIMMISRKSGTTEWLKNIDSDYNYLEATIKDNVLTLKNPTVAMVATMTVSGSLEVGGNVLTSTKITNTGTFFNKQFYLMVDGEDVGGRYLDLDAQESGTVDILFSPTKAGTKKIELGYYPYNETTQNYEVVFNVVAKKEVTIAAAKSYSLKFSEGKVTNASEMNIYDNKASLRFTVKNTGTEDYNNDIMIFSFKDNEEQLSRLIPLTLVAGQSKVVNYDMPLSSDGMYSFVVVYKTEGKFIDYNDFGKRYSDLSGYNVEIPAEDPSGIQTLSNASAPAKQSIYTIGGMRLTPQQFENAPKGLYIVNGRLVTK